MGCCGKAIKTAKQITEGYSNLIKGKRFEFTNERVKICRTCEFNYWIKRTLWCSICKCFIPAKARVKENTCPKKKWRV